MQSEPLKQTLESYLELRRKRELEGPRPRAFCPKCRQAKVVCDCADLLPFEAPVEFAILIHPEEARRRIATGRLTHSILKNSYLLEGESFDSHPRVQAFLTDPTRDCFILYPSSDSLNLSKPETQAKFTAGARKPLIFVIDGTWRTAKKMLRLSPSLSLLPRVSFDSPGLSRFRIRKQPASVCLSTLEAVHHVIELLNPRFSENREHDQLLKMFDRMVERQIDYQKRLGSSTLSRKSVKQTSRRFSAETCRGK